MTNTHRKRPAKPLPDLAITDELYAACERGKLDVVKTYVDEDIRYATSSNHWMPCLAAQKAHLNLVEYFLEKGIARSTMAGYVPHMTIRNKINVEKIDKLLLRRTNRVSISAQKKQK